MLFKTFKSHSSKRAVSTQLTQGERSYKEFGFTAGMLKGSLAKGRGEK